MTRHRCLSIPLGSVSHPDRGGDAKKAPARGWSFLCTCNGTGHSTHGAGRDQVGELMINMTIDLTPFVSASPGIVILIWVIRYGPRKLDLRFRVRLG